MRPVLPSSVEAASDSWSTPAPVGGWNARDSIAQMSALDAVQLDNWFPDTTQVKVRPGRVEVAELPGGNEIKTLLGVSKADGNYRRFAASENGIFDITPGGSILAPVEVVSTAFWESVQINVGGISYLWCCAGDGANKVRLYNSTANTWLAMDGATVPALTGIPSTDVTNVGMWKYRLILCERNSLKFYYGPLNSVGGAFSAFDLGSVFKKGGHLVATANWTVDAGDGVDDRFVAISSEGEVALYQGTDPSSANTFSLVGVYNVGKPIGKRCFLQLAGDLGVLTEQGLWPLSRALQSATVDKRLALTDKIQAAFNSHYKLFGNTFGWQPVLLPKGPALLVNVPLSDVYSYQFVMNLITGAWCKFTEWDAACMTVLDGKLYFAIGNMVWEGWVGTTDDGQAITATAAQAYSYGPTRKRAKKVKMVRPILQVTSPVNVAVAMNSDFAEPLTMSPDPSVPTVGSLWDSAIFDESTWDGLTFSQRGWKNVNHSPSRAFSLQLAVAVQNITVAWSQTDFMGEKTGVSLA